MTTYDFERPFVNAETIPLYEALDGVVSARYGQKVRATKLSNIEYKIRFNRLSQTNRIRPPPRTGRIFSGYLVIRTTDTLINLFSSNNQASVSVKLASGDTITRFVDPGYIVSTDLNGSVAKESDVA